MIKLIDILKEIKIYPKDVETIEGLQRFLNAYKKEFVNFIFDIMGNTNDPEWAYIRDEWKNEFDFEADEEDPEDFLRLGGDDAILVSLKYKDLNDPTLAKMKEINFKGIKLYYVFI